MRKLGLYLLNDLGNIFISLDEDNDLEEEITDLLMNVFFFQAYKNKRNQIGSKYIHNLYINTALLRTTSSTLSRMSAVWYGLEPQFSQIMMSQC